MSGQRPQQPPGGPSDVPFAGLPAGPDARLTWAPAKVNLFLEVLGRRPDGYHEVETLILAVDLFDTLEVRDDPSGDLTLVCDPPGPPAGPGNLVYKAADALRRAVGVDRGAAVRLTKRIPTEAGLGGGSSDAAAAIAALDQVWQLGLPRDRLLTVAAEVGSDVGFFLSPPAGWCTGRGERVEPEPVGRPLDLVVVKPPVGLPTAAVYRRVTVPERPRSGEAARAALRAGEPESVAEALFNRLQAAAFDAAPEVERVYRRLSGCGPLGCLLSGSGSAVFAVCRDRADAASVAGRFREADRDSSSGCQVYVVRSYWPSPR
jgi:4-diphosphocytidyl-2-C-methyl-D-erythritol kinase